ncbi:MAG: hypothetical protein ACFHXK_13660 [bacterium]
MTEEQQALSQSGVLDAQLSRRLGAATLAYSYVQIERALDQLSVEVTVAFQDQSPQCICVLPEGLVFAGMLLRRLIFPLSLYTTAEPPDTPATQVLDLARPVLLLSAEMGLPSLQAWLDWLPEGAARCVVLLQAPAAQAPADYAALPGLAGEKVGCGLQYQGYAANWGGVYLLPEQTV